MQRTRPYKATPFRSPRTRTPTITRTTSISSARNYSRPVRRGPPGEVKYLDTVLNFAFDTTGEVPATGQLNLIPQGAGEQERIGRKVHIKSIHIKANLLPNTAAWSGGTTIRLLLVQDKQCNGAAATYSGVNGVLQNDSTMSFRNITNVDRFIIHKDWNMPINAPAGVTGSFSPKATVLEFHKKCDIPIEFDNSAATGALTTIRSSNLFLLARGSPAGDDDLIAVTGFARIRYIDG